MEAEVIHSLHDTDAGVAFHSAMAVGSLRKRQDALPHLIERLTLNNDADPYLTHGLVVALVAIGDTNTIHRAAQDISPAVRRAALLAMRRLELPEIARFLNDSQPRLRYEAARAINDVPIEAALPDLALFLGKADCTTNLMSRAINACFRLGTERHAKMLASFANRLDVPDEFRARALEMLGHWRVEEVEPGRIPTVLERDARHGATPVVNPENWPGWFDGVVGLWRPLPRRNEQAGKRALLSVGASVLADGKAERAQLAVIRAAVRLQAVEAGHGLFENLRAKNVSAAVRREIPAALAALRYAQTGEAVKLALADPDSTVRQAGIALLDQVGAGDTAAVLDALLATESNVALAQTVFATLGRLPGAAADDVLARWLGKLRAGEVRAELRLDLLEAAKQRTAPVVATAVQKINAALPAKDPLAPWRDTLAGGDAERGREVFNQHAGAQCLRCHALSGKGGTVGPDLAGVGARLTRELLLESMVFPNKTIAAGFENVVVALKGGGSRAGVVKSETATELVLHSLEDGVVRVPKNTIQARVAGLSAMPEGLAQVLTRRELRDVVEFLAGLK